MNILTTGTIFASAVGLVFCIIMLIRNDRVAKHRNKIIDKIHNASMEDINQWAAHMRLGETAIGSPLNYRFNYDIFDKVSYDYVMYHFWRFDLDSFYPEEYRVGKD